MMESKVSPFTINGLEQEQFENDPEKRMYLLLTLETDDDGNDIKYWEFLQGRTLVRDTIKNIIDNLNIHKSKVFSESANMHQALSVYQFMKYMEGFYTEDDFDIEEYNHGYDESEE